MSFSKPSKPTSQLDISLSPFISCRRFLFSEHGWDRIQNGHLSGATGVRGTAVAGNCGEEEPIKKQLKTDFLRADQRTQAFLVPCQTESSWIENSLIHSCRSCNVTSFEIKFSAWAPPYMEIPSLTSSNIPHFTKQRDWISASINLLVSARHPSSEGSVKVGMKLKRLRRVHYTRGRKSSGDQS